MNFSHSETIELAVEIVGSALYLYDADYVECSGCDAEIDKVNGSITHNLPDCKVAAVEARLDQLECHIGGPVICAVANRSSGMVARIKATFDEGNFR